jgi:iron complex transport system substrate-binding protein
MKKVSFANGVALAAALTLSLVVAVATGHRTRTAPPAASPSPAVRPVALPDGGLALPDATSHLVPLRSYRRIVSGSTITDALLVELCEPDRVVAFTAYSARTSPWAYRYAGKPTVEGVTALEPVLALRPDLVMMNSFGDLGRVDKLRAAGVEVFDFGEMRGMATLLPTIERMALLLGHPERGARYAHHFQQRMRSVAAGLGNRRRLTAVYVSAIGPLLTGGTVGTSYHDVLEAAGLVDAAAARFRDWQRYAPEQLVLLDPDRLVTKEGTTAMLCGYPGLERLAACRTPGGVIEVPGSLIDDPGPPMLDAAESIYEQAYGR